MCDGTLSTMYTQNLDQEYHLQCTFAMVFHAFRLKGIICIHLQLQFYEFLKVGEKYPGGTFS